MKLCTYSVIISCFNYKLLEVTNVIVVGTQIIIDVSIFFNSSSKKRVFNNQSCNGEEPKKARGGSLNDSSVSLADVFIEGTKSSECLHILVNCLKNIEAKIKKKKLGNESGNTG